MKPFRGRLVVCWVALFTFAPGCRRSDPPPAPVEPNAAAQRVVREGKRAAAPPLAARTAVEPTVLKQPENRPTGLPGASPKTPLRTNFIGLQTAEPTRATKPPKEGSNKAEV